MAKIHTIDKRDWDRRTWKFPLIHNYNFGFGLTADSASVTKRSTIVPYMFQDDIAIDLETIMTNPANSGFMVSTAPNVTSGSYIPSIRINWVMYMEPADTELTHLLANTMPINTSMLNRLDAFDKKTGNDIETILELTHETDEEQTLVLWNGVKLFEQSTDKFDYHADVEGLTTTQRPEGIAFDKELFFDAMHYYTNKDMLKTVTGGMKTHVLSEPIIPHGRSIVTGGRSVVPSLCKFANPYMFCGELFHVPPENDRSQYAIGTSATDKAHLWVKGFVRFNEYNPDFSFERA